ncbi:MAG: TonB-dependent receptor [Pseudomonadota bacterium]
MNTQRSFRARLLLSSGLAFFALTTPSVAQEAQDNPTVSVTQGDDAEAEPDAIVVTGTRLRVPNLESTAPITTVNKDFIDQRNFINVADALNTLPQVRGSVTPDGDNAGFGQGVNFLNLYGLGSNRTLTLINGRRVVSSNAPTLFSAGAPGIQVDLNILPAALIESVDVLSTEGAPVYGSDAIAGVVNVNLIDDYEGLDLIATSSITEEGDGFQFRIEGVYGSKFADGRGHIQVSSFYTETNGVLENQRQLFRDNVETEPNTISFNRVNPNLPFDTGPDDGVPAQVLFSDVTLFPLSNTGVIIGGPLGVSTGPNGSQSGDTGFQFDTAGNLVPFAVGQRPVDPATGLPTGIRGIGGDGFQFSDFGQLTSDLRRFGANLFLNYDVTDTINVFVEGQYYDARADELVDQPTFNSTLFGGASSALTFSADNPLLNDQARGVLAEAGVEQFTISRANVGFADLTGATETEFLRGVIGARGEFELFGQSDWRWEASFTYGQSEVNDFNQNINQQNFTNAINVTTDDAGNVICDVNPANPVQAGFTPVADSRCVPLNFFGLQASPEALDYVIAETRSRSVLEQTVANVNFGGTLFELNENPVVANIGYEHRREAGSFTPDEFLQAGLGRSVAIPPIDGSFSLNEVFGEVLAQLITPSNDAFIHRLQVQASGRYVDNSLTGGFFSWSAGGQLAPIEDITFRGSFTRSFRAPSLTELFLPQANAFDTVPDLCFAANITAGPNPEARERNCNAFLAAFPNIERPQQANNATVPILTGGNLDLENEQSDSWTIGAILQPRFLSGFTATVDYVNISISDPIANFTVDDINSACFDNDDFDTSDPANGNAFCSRIQRGTNGEVVSDPNNPGVLTGFGNGVGIDLEVIQAGMNYQTGLEGIGIPGTLALSGNLTVTLRRVEDLTGVAPAREDGELEDPQFAGLLSANYINDNWGFGTVIDYTGEQLFSRFAREPDTREFDQLDDFVTVDLNAFFETEDNFRFNFVVQNLFDRRCQRSFGFCIAASIPGARGGDAFGRTFSVSARKSF